MKPNTKCTWCNPSITQQAWSPQPRGYGCDDEVMCTFYDKCNGNGTCAGSPDDCLRSSFDPTQQCETCGRDACVKASAYAGCQFSFDWVASSAAQLLQAQGLVFAPGFATLPVSSWYAPGALRVGNTSMIDAALLVAASRASVPASTPFVYVLGGKRACGCSIDGACYPHLALNPREPCLWCDVTLNTTAWSPTPVKPCNDRNPCSYADLCSAGVCSGIPINCNTTAPCVFTSKCQGTDTCAVVYQPTSYMCLASRSTCLPPVYCDGIHGACPPAPTILPRVIPGAIQLIVPPQYTGMDASRVAAALNASVVAPALLGGAVDASLLGYPLLAGSQRFTIRTVNWSTSCGNITYRLGLYTDPQNLLYCSPDPVTSATNGLGWTPTFTTVYERNSWQALRAAGFDMNMEVNSSTVSAIADGTIVRARVEAASSDGTISFGYNRVVVSTSIHLSHASLHTSPLDCSRMMTPIHVPCQYHERV